MVSPGVKGYNKNYKEEFYVNAKPFVPPPVEEYVPPVPPPLVIDDPRPIPRVYNVYPQETVGSTFLWVAGSLLVLYGLTKMAK